MQLFTINATIEMLVYTVIAIIATKLYLKIDWFTVIKIGVIVYITWRILVLLLI